MRPLFPVLLLAAVAMAILAQPHPAIGSPVAGELPTGWLRLAGGPAPDTGSDVAVGPDGSLFVVGSARGRTFLGLDKPGETDIVLLKYSPEGVLRWARFLGGTSHDYGEGVAVGHDGAVYVTGASANAALAGQRNAGGADVVLARHTADGARSWVRLFGTSRGDWGRGVAVAADGNVYVTGEIGRPRLARPDEDLLVAKFDPAGREIWRTRRGGSLPDVGHGIAVDAAGDAVYVAGSSASERFGGRENRGETDLVLLKLDSDGQRKWVRSDGGTQIDRGQGVAVADDGSVYVTGEADVPVCCGQPASFGDLLVEKYTTDGRFEWGRRERRDGFDRGTGIAVDDDGRVLVAGESGGQPFATGDSQIVMLQYQPDGVKRLRRQFGGNGYDTAGGLAVGDAVYIAGTAGKPFGGDAGYGESDVALIATANGPLPKHVRTHPAGTRTGVEDVDVVLDAIEAGDVDALVSMAAYEMVPCDNHPGPGIILPPRCPPGVPDGTPVQALKVASSTWRWVSPEALPVYLRLGLRSMHGLFGVEEAKVGDNLKILPDNGYGIILAVEENLEVPGFGGYEAALDAPDADGLLIGLGADGITGLSFGCGQAPGLMFWKDASWLVAPLGHAE